MTKLEALVNSFSAGKIAPHVYQSDGASRDPECRVKGCKWDWDEHVSAELLSVIKESSDAKGAHSER